MNTSDGLWTIVYESFSYHQQASDPDPQSALDRIAKKCLRLSERKSFNPTSCTITELKLSKRDLKDILVYHDRDVPIKMHGPIVLLSYDDKLYAIEGNTRTNAWRNGKYNGPFSAILLKSRS